MRGALLTPASLNFVYAPNIAETSMLAEQQPPQAAEDFLSCLCVTCACESSAAAPVSSAVGASLYIHYRAWLAVDLLVAAQRGRAATKRSVSRILPGRHLPWVSVPACLASSAWPAAHCLCRAAPAALPAGSRPGSALPPAGLQGGSAPVDMAQPSQNNHSHTHGFAHMGSACRVTVPCAT